MHREHQVPTKRRQTASKLFLWELAACLAIYKIYYNNFHFLLFRPRSSIFLVVGKVTNSLKNNGDKSSRKGTLCLIFDHSLLIQKYIQ